MSSDNEEMRSFFASYSSECFIFNKPKIKCSQKIYAKPASGSRAIRESRLRLASRAFFLRARCVDGDLGERATTLNNKKSVIKIISWRRMMSPWTLHLDGREREQMLTLLDSRRVQRDWINFLCKHRELLITAQISKLFSYDYEISYLTR